MAGNARNTKQISRFVPVRRFERYITIPFESKGRDFKGVDCWGLVCLIYMTELNIELPTYGEISATDLASVNKNITDGYNGETWVAVDRNNMKPFDVVVMKFAGSSRIGHCGIYIGNNKLIHAEKKIDVAIVPLCDHSVTQRISAFRRHVELT